MVPNDADRWLGRPELTEGQTYNRQERLCHNTTREALQHGPTTSEPGPIHSLPFCHPPSAPGKCNMYVQRPLILSAQLLIPPYLTPLRTGLQETAITPDTAD